MGEENRIFIGGIGWNTTERLLKDTFSRYGKIVDCLVMTDRNTGRPRGFAFITFADHRAAEDALREMHGSELDGRVISVNRADPKIGAQEPDYGYGGGARGARDSYRSDNSRSDECFKCGRMGHWARDCPSGSNDRYSSKSVVGAGSIRGDRYGDDRVDDHFHGNRYSDRERMDISDRYGARDRYDDRYPTIIDDRFGDDRYGDRSMHSGYGRERSYERYEDLRGGDRYGSGGPTRYDLGIHRDRPGPYDNARRGSRGSAYDNARRGSRGSAYYNARRGSRGSAYDRH